MAASEHDAAFGVLNRVRQSQAGTEDGKPLLDVRALGLAPFVGRGIEFVPKPLPAYPMFTVLALRANWLLLQGPVFEDGHTFGVSETERVRVRHRGPMVRTSVLLMDIGTLDPSVTRFADWGPGRQVQDDPRSAAVRASAISDAASRTEAAA